MKEGFTVVFFLYLLDICEAICEKRKTLASVNITIRRIVHFIAGRDTDRLNIGTAEHTGEQRKSALHGEARLFDAGIFCRTFTIWNKVGFTGTDESER